MKKIFIYLDETYNLQNKNQFYCFAGFITSESENVKIEYKRILHKLKLLSKTSNKEIKSTDKEAKRIREKLLKNEKILSEIELIGIYQLKDSMNFKYFRELTGEQEKVYYEYLLQEIITEIVKEKRDENISINIILEIDKNDKIKKEYYKNLKEEIKEIYCLKNFEIEITDSNKSLGLQLADQIAGLCREYIKEEEYFDVIERFKKFIINPLSR